MENHGGIEGSSETYIVDMTTYRHIFGSDPLEFAEPPKISLGYLHVKRTLDVVVSLVAILMLFLPGLLIAAAVVATSKGPLIYRETRVGRNGLTFRIWKFRSMRSDAFQQSRLDSAEPVAPTLDARMRKPLRDPRATVVGSFLRVWSIDEFPQFLNVLRGEMSLIGPRPIVEEELHLYGDQLNSYLSVKPGMSGLWQVSGRSNLDYAKRVALDAEYARTCSLNTDLNLLFRTIPAVLRCEGSR